MSTGSEDVQTEGDATALSKSTLRLIDHAFNEALRESDFNHTGTPERRPQKGLRTSNEPAIAPGGFLLDDDNGAGFIAEDNDAISLDDGDEQNLYNEMTSNHIPLSLIPRALQILDLPPDDHEVLEVFANAASGWKGELPRGDGEDVVSRRDWRAVCSVLLPTKFTPDRQESGDDADLIASNSSPLSSMSEYQSSGGDPEDEYIPGGKSQTGKTASRSSRSKAREGVSLTKRGADSPTIAYSLTSRQRREARIAFSLFFSDSPRDSAGDVLSGELEKRVLTIKDIANAAGRIKEKIGAEEIIEMLSAFSTVPSHGNPTMTLAEFERMMVAARLV